MRSAARATIRSRSRDHNCSPSSRFPPTPWWRQSTGLYFHETPELESVNGLFIQAGIDARTGLVSGAAISRSWT